MNDFWLYMLVFGVAIIIALAFYAGMLLQRLNKQKRQQKQALLAKQQSLNNHDKKVFDSVLLITRAMQQEQCDFDEGCWRLSVLMSSLKTVTELSVEFPAVFGLYDEIKDLAILDARKILTKQERMREDYKRMTALTNMHDAVVAELDALHKYTVEQLARLSV
jgi:Tfp pilus assembly protein PilN